MRALVVDDDIHTFKALQILIDTEKYPFTELDYAKSGEEALKIMEKNKYELIFSDMQMPGLGGVGFLEKMREVNKTVQIIVISGYNDFKYAKAALVAESIDYLLKPITRRELETALDKVLHRIEKNEDFYQKSLAMNEYMSQDARRILAFWIERNREYTKILEKAMEAFGIGDAKSRISLLLFMEPRKVCQDIFQGNHENMIFCVENIAQRIFVKSSFCRIIPIDEYLNILLTQTELSDEAGYEESMKILQRHLKNIMCLDSVFAYSDRLGNLQNLPDVFEKMKKLILVRPLKDMNRHSKEEVLPDAAGKGLMEEEEVLKKAVQNSDFLMIGKIISEFTHKLQRKENLTLYELQLNTIEVNLMLKRFLGACKDFHLATLHEIPLWIYSLDDWEETVKQRFYEISSFSYEREEGVTAIHSYIIQHYKEDISISWLAAFFSLSPQYIAKIYKLAYQKTVGETIRDCRLEEAKRYLIYSNMSINEIAHEIGYEDENYFGKIFRNNVGLTPLRYRRGYRNNESI